MTKSILVIVCTLLLMMLGLSCGEDLCEDLLCQNGGDCLEGICDCPDGFVGELCEFESGSFIDSRDNNIYKWVILKDGRKWMAENLKYSNNFSIGWCYDDNPFNCEEYGRLYLWQTALTACPEGWHLPSDDEWHSMFTQYGNEYWLDDFSSLHENGNSGLNLLKGGKFSFDWLITMEMIGYESLNHEGNYWSSTMSDPERVWGFQVGFMGDIGRSSISYNKYSPGWVSSCRCIED